MLFCLQFSRHFPIFIFDVNIIYISITTDPSGANEIKSSKIFCIVLKSKMCFVLLAFYCTSFLYLYKRDDNDSMCMGPNIRYNDNARAIFYFIPFNSIPFPSNSIKRESHFHRSDNNMKVTWTGRNI